MKPDSRSSSEFQYKYKSSADSQTDSESSANSEQDSKDITNDRQSYTESTGSKEELDFEQNSESLTNSQRKLESESHQSDLQNKSNLDIVSLRDQSSVQRRYSYPSQNMQFPRQPESEPQSQQRSQAGQHQPQQSVQQAHLQPGQQPPPYGYQQQSQPHQQPSPYNYQQQAFPGQIQPNMYAYPVPGPYPKAPSSSLYRSGKRDQIPPPTFEESQTPQGGGARWESFLDKKVRRIFVRKVYMILTLQLIFTLGIISLFVFEPHVNAFVKKTPELYYVALAVFIGVFLGLACFPHMRRKYPTNLIMLIIFTLAMSYLMGTLSSFFNTEAVFIAVGICATVCFAITILSFYTKFDFTTCGSMLCILLVILILFGFIAIFIRSKLMTMIYAGLGAVVFMMYLAYDTQLIMGGRHIEIDPEEYIFAALMLYIDILYIYMFILMLFGIGNQ